MFTQLEFPLGESAVDFQDNLHDSHVDLHADLTHWSSVEPICSFLVWNPRKQRSWCELQNSVWSLFSADFFSRTCEYDIKYLIHMHWRLKCCGFCPHHYTLYHDLMDQLQNYGCSSGALYDRMNTTYKKILICCSCSLYLNCNTVLHCFRTGLCEFMVKL